MYPFKDGCFAPRNGWYVAAFRHEVGRSLVSRWILNEPVVLYRTEAGEATAIDGRCPHRHFPLGQSRLEGDNVVCGYHGITFGPDGRCVRVPSQSHVPSSYRVRRYPIAEHGVWVFIWPGDPALADPALLPDIGQTGWDAPGFRVEPFYALEIEGRYQLLNDNLLDLTHLAYLHSGSIGVGDNASVPEERVDDGMVLRSRRTMPGVAMAPAHRGRYDYDGPVDRVTSMDFHLPGFHAGMDRMAIPADHPTRGGETLSDRRVIHAVTPGKYRTTNYFFALGGALSDEEFERSRAFLATVIEEDVMATREIETMLTTLGHVPPELMLKSDASAVIGRRALQAMMDREAAAAAAAAATATA